MHVQQLLVSLSRILRILSALERFSQTQEKRAVVLDAAPGGSWPRYLMRGVSTAATVRGQHRAASLPAGASHLPTPAPTLSEPGLRRADLAEWYPICLRSGKRVPYHRTIRYLAAYGAKRQVRGIHQLAGGLDAPI